MKFSELAPRERHNFVYFLLFFFFYYFIMSAYFPFFPVWLADVNHLTKTETGIVFSSISLFAIIFQPVFGLMSDKLGLRKHLLWTITVLLILFAPFFIFVFSPLLQMNIIAGSLVGGIYLGIVFSSGSGAVEAYIERVSRANRFEYGKVRVAGCVGWALCASITGVLFGIEYYLLDRLRLCAGAGSSALAVASGKQQQRPGYRGARGQSPGLFAAYGGRAAAYAALLGLYRLCGGGRQRLRRV